MNFMVRAGTSRGFIGTSVVTKALMTEGPPEKVVDENVPGAIFQARRIPTFDKSQFLKILENNFVRLRCS